MDDIKEANKLCNNLLTNYDATAILKYPKEIQETFLKASEEKKRGNKTLLQLIRNMRKGNQPVYDYISGPTIIYKMSSNKYNKVVYLIGEEHGNNGCDLSRIRGAHIDIIDYLVQLFSTTPKFIDFYAEFPIMLKETIKINPLSGQRIWNMLIKMQDCFGDVHERKCPYTARLHSVDARRISNISNKINASSVLKITTTTDTISRNIFSMTDYLRENSHMSNVLEFKKQYITYIDLLANIKNNSDIEKMMYSTIKQHKILQKELSRSTIDPNIIIKFFVESTLNSTKKSFKNSAKILSDWANSVKRARSLYPKTTDSCVTVLIMLFTCILDIYAAARMFKVFKTTSTSYQPAEAHNIIYYTGQIHTKSMVAFMKSIGFSTLETNAPVIDHCLDMRGIKQPLFSNN